MEERIIIRIDSNNEGTCQLTPETIIDFVVKPSSFSIEDRVYLSNHLKKCEKCKGIVEEIKVVMQTCDHPECRHIRVVINRSIKHPNNMTPFNWTEIDYHINSCVKCMVFYRITKQSCIVIFEKAEDLDFENCV